MHEFSGAHGAMVTVVGNGHGNPSSKPWTGIYAFHIALEKIMNPYILLPAIGK